MVRTSGIRIAMRALLQTMWRAFHIRRFRRDYEHHLQDEMLCATSAEGISFASDLSVAAAGGFLYTPVAPERLVEALRSADADLSRFVFVDLGCGRGRALVLA